MSLLKRAFWGIVDYYKKIKNKIRVRPSPGELTFRINQQLSQTVILQKLLIEQFKKLEYHSINEAFYSYKGESDTDGILLYIFAKAGFTNRFSIDIGAGNCIDGNTANLILHHHFQGLFIDGSNEAIEFGKGIYESVKISIKPQFCIALLTTKNVNEIIGQYEMPPSPDLLSIDIDSIDLYILKAIHLKPRVIILEFNNLWGPNESYSVPEVDYFERELGEFLYGGASLAAFSKVLQIKGYKLVAVDSSGYDAYFVLNNQDFAFLPEKTTTELYENSINWKASHINSLNSIFRKKNWVEII